LGDFNGKCDLVAREEIGKKPFEKFPFELVITGFHPKST
jgi:hypothetical protein